MTDNSADQRTGYIAGLRALADLLEQHDEVPLPFTGSSYSPIAISDFLHAEDPKGDLAAAARAFPGRLDKDVRDDYFDLRGQLGSLHVKFTAYREAVCERIVTGTREVTREVVVPIETRTETVTEVIEDVEWVCAPLLQPVEVSA